MASTILWDANPSAEVIMAAAGGPLRNLANGAIAVSSEVTNGTDLKRWADFELYVHDFAAAPTAGGYFELHICYQLDGTNYADGEDGDLADPNLSAATLVGIFPILNSDEDQRVQCCGVPLRPFDFKVCVKNSCGQAIPDTDNSKLTLFRYTEESQ